MKKLVTILIFACCVGLLFNAFTSNVQGINVILLLSLLLNMLAYGVISVSESLKSAMKELAKDPKSMINRRICPPHDWQPEIDKETNRQRLKCTGCLRNPGDDWE